MTLIRRINDQVLHRNTWPPPGHRETWERIDFCAALRRSDETRLKQYANVAWNRRYLMSPVPRLISRAKGSLLYGEPVDVRAADERDQENMDRIMRENMLAAGHSAELHRAATIASSEREVWGRVIVAPALLDVPIIEFASRRNVIPHFTGRFVTGATFIKEWEDGSRRVLRLLEHYEPGQIRSELYDGTLSLLGSGIDLKSFGPTEGIEPIVFTGFGRPLCAFIPNSLDGDPTQGFGDYTGLEERFLAVNEAATIGQENLRLAGQKRALLDAKYTRGGRMVAGPDVFIRESSEIALGAGDTAGKPLQLLEYTFEAQQLALYLDNLIDTTLTFGGAAPQLVGRSVDGGAISGTALRLKLVHSLMEASGTGGYFDRGSQRLARMAAIIDSRGISEGGFGRRWVAPDEDPTVSRGDGLPHDDMEAAQWLVLVAGAEAISLGEKVAWVHPDWSAAQIEEEVEKIGAGASPAPAEMPPPAGLPAAPVLPGGPSPTPPGVPEPATVTAAR